MIACSFCLGQNLSKRSAAGDRDGPAYHDDDNDYGNAHVDNVWQFGVRGRDDHIGNDDRDGDDASLSSVRQKSSGTKTEGR